jgi:hypothetical protein
MRSTDQTETASDQPREPRWHAAEYEAAMLLRNNFRVHFLNRYMTVT